MKTSITMFTSLSKPALKLPFNLANFGAAVPINSSDENLGTIVYPIGSGATVGGGIYVKETLGVVTEAVQGWYNHAAQLAHGTA